MTVLRNKISDGGQTIGSSPNNGAETLLVFVKATLVNSTQEIAGVGVLLRFDAKQKTIRIDKVLTKLPGGTGRIVCWFRHSKD